MDETVKVQEEFENLIKELERLKSINDLTSANTESAKKVVAEIDSFIGSVKAYQEKIENELDSHSKAIETLISKLNQSIQRFHEESEELSKDVDDSIDSFSAEIQQNFSKRFMKHENAINELNKSLNSVSKNISETESNIIENEELLLASFNKKLDDQDQEIKKLKNILFIISGLLVLGIVLLIFTLS